MYVSVRYGGKYTPVALSVGRFGVRMGQDRAMAKFVERMRRELVKGAATT
jgi:hypothetical protein